MTFPTYIAHRGAGKLAPENTLAAFQLGAQLGHKAFECDVKLSADEVCLLLHDDTLERTTNGTGLAGRQLWAQLAQLDAGSWLSAQFAGSPIASLADIAQFCRPRGDWVNLEIKPTTGTDARTGELVAHAANALWGAKAHHLVLSSFSTVALQAAHAAQPHLAVAHLFETLPANWQDLVRCVAGQGVVFDAALVSPGIVRNCHDNGWWCASYTVNDPQVAQRLLSWGIDHLITDRVDLFKN
jgi:glycerophosphoryl diester phosphodiesterase